MTPQNSFLIERGVSKVSVLYGLDGIADERIVDYMCYQAYRLRGMMVSQRAVFNVSWYFSDNAIQKYHKQFMGDGKSGMMYYIDQWLMENNTSRNKLTAALSERTKHSVRRFTEMPSEEPVKMRMLNKPAGYSLCQISTTGWSPASRACRMCDYSEKCHEETNVKYPELTRLREQMTINK